MNISRFPRIRLSHLPTPLEPMPNLSKRLGGPRLWITRDDCTGLSSGAGLISLAQRGHFKADSDVVFLHTSGAVGLFGYSEDFGLPGYIH
jgi:1-aminocyclopropane-1-carboxylate deaminase/D-cysteine desulfhydrase-like pyridoxal-dependent ACC family enzyme